MKEEVKLRGPQVCAVGVNHGTAPIAVRERLGIPKTRMQDALASLRNYVPAGVILSTCNRTEVYAIHDRGRSVEAAVREFLSHWSGLDQERLAPYLYICRNYAAMRHLSEAAAGLRSMILGEHEILGQVGQALEEAEKAEMVDLPLRRLFHHAISIGRRARNETEISRNALSASSVAVDLAAKVTGNIGDCKVLLIGAGEAGKLVVRALAQRGVSQISVMSRSLASAEHLASILDARAVDFNEMRSEIATSDILISCTGSPHYVVHHEVVEKVMASRPDRSLVLIDIAVPRDIEPGIEHIPGVFLYDIDDLNDVLGTNRDDRAQEVEKVNAIVTDELAHLLAWWETLDVRPTVSALMDMAESIRQQQLSLTLKKLPPMSEEQRECLEAMTKSIVNKVLHNPIHCLKHNGHDSGDFVQIVRELFALKEANSG